MEDIVNFKISVHYLAITNNTSNIMEKLTGETLLGSKSQV